MFAQQSLQPILSRRRYAGVPYALQNNTVFRRAQNESVTAMDHEQTIGVNSKVLDQKQQNIFGPVVAAAAAAVIVVVVHCTLVITRFNITRIRL